MDIKPFCLGYRVQEVIMGNFTDSEKLRNLAKWLDVKYPTQKDEVQQDLRRIADNLEEDIIYIHQLRGALTTK